MLTDEGIKERGTHEELMKTSEDYQEIYYSQFKKEESGR